MGDLRGVLTAASDRHADPAWITAVVDAIERELGSTQRSMLLVKRVTAGWFHSTFTENRTSIRHHGLDYRRMVGPGIAGSPKPEAADVFLSWYLDSARWFARMGRRGPVDIWAADLVDAWLVGDPGAGGGDDIWMISPEPISPSRLTLVAKDLTDSF
jgi:hypothetical protein